MTTIFKELHDLTLYCIISGFGFSNLPSQTLSAKMSKVKCIFFPIRSPVPTFLFNSFFMICNYKSMSCFIRLLCIFSIWCVNWMRTEPGFSHRFLSTASTGIPLRDLFNSCRINEERNQWTDSLPHFTKDLRLPRKTIQAIEKIQVNNSGSGNNGKLSVKKKRNKDVRNKISTWKYTLYNSQIWMYLS